MARPASYDVLSWLDVLASQAHGLDLHVYSDPVTHPQRPFQPFPSTHHLADTPTLPQHPADFTPSLYQDYTAPHQPFHASQSHSIYVPPPWDPPATDDGCSSIDTPTDSESVGTSTVSRAKPKIALDSNQPLTIDGKPRERVYVACDHCRTRKLRCDGAKPACYNCQRLGDPNVRCRYEQIPRRRGQDKAPRVRSPAGQRKPRKSASRKEQRDPSISPIPGNGGGHGLSLK